jgi:Animal haem peroxidase
MTIITSGHGTIDSCVFARRQFEAAPEQKSAIQSLMAALPGRTQDSEFSRYTYLFPQLADDDRASLPADHTPQETHEHLLALAEKLAELQGFDEPTGDLPSVYTYFGQFLNHDISAPLMRTMSRAHDIDSAVTNVPDLETLNAELRPATIADVLGEGKRPDRAELINQHPVPMMLHSLYGSGPFPDDAGRTASEFYEAGQPLFRLGQTVTVPDSELETIIEEPRLVKRKIGAADLPRDAKQRQALIGDSRNDENLIIGQLHLAFMLFHNKAAKWPRIDGGGKGTFDAARELLTWHYQWCVVHDFLKNLLDAKVYGRAIGDLDQIPPLDMVPMEFAAAVFRFGHSMVSSQYDFNENFSKGGVVSQASLQSLFDFTSHRGLGGHDRLPDHWVADWSMLTGDNAAARSKSDRIDPFLVGLMLGLQDTKMITLASIAARNLLRGFHRRIPSGQSLAKATGMPPMSPKEIAKAVAEVKDFDRFLQKSGFDKQTPAWLYVLSEARAKSRGSRLGPMASEIVARTILGLLRGNPASVLNAKGGSWSPADSPLRTPAGKPVADIKTFLQFSGAM